MYLCIFNLIYYSRRTIRDLESSLLWLLYWRIVKVGFQV